MNPDGKVLATRLFFLMEKKNIAFSLLIIVIGYMQERLWVVEGGDEEN